jgi:hypothetical protein
MALERLLPSDEIMGPDTYRKINAAIDEVNEMQRASYYGYGDPNQRPLTKPKEQRRTLKTDPTLDASFQRPMDWREQNTDPYYDHAGSGQSEAAFRKEHPMATGVLDYFPDALMEIAHLSKVGNDQHNPGQPLHWARGKSTDHADALLRHLKDRGTRDTDGERHSTKVAWRALANLQTEIENERKNGYINPTISQPKENLS